MPCTEKVQYTDGPVLATASRTSPSLRDQIFEGRWAGNPWLKCFDLQYVFISQLKPSNNISLPLPSCHQSTDVFQMSIRLYNHALDVLVSVSNNLYSSRPGNFFLLYALQIKGYGILQNRSFSFKKKKKNFGTGLFCKGYTDFSRSLLIGLTTVTFISDVNVVPFVATPAALYDCIG